MSREVRRVPMNHGLVAIGSTWDGYIMPARLREASCPSCENGLSPMAEQLFKEWWGNAPFHPASTGSKPFAADHPRVRAFAESNVESAPEFYGTGEHAIVREANRLLSHWNGMWAHHLSQDDVDAIFADDRIRDITHRFDPVERWVRIDPQPELTAEYVNEFYIGLRGIGYLGTSEAYLAIQARCKKVGASHLCETCGGNASLEVYPGQRAEADAWEAPEFPTGDAWQMWQTVTEGGPVSPTLESPEQLAAWMRSTDRWSQLTEKQALDFVTGPGWAPTAISFGGGPVVDGVTAIATREVQ